MCEMSRTATNVHLERSASHSQAHNPKSTSCRLRCSLRILPRHKSFERTSTRQEEGEEHQAFKIYPPGRNHQYCADNAIQVVSEGSEGHC